MNLCTKRHGTIFATRLIEMFEPIQPRTWLTLAIEMIAERHHFMKIQRDAHLGSHVSWAWRFKNVAAAGLTQGNFSTIE